MIKEEEDDIFVESLNNKLYDDEYHSEYNQSNNFYDNIEEDNLNDYEKNPQFYDELIFKCEGINFPVVRGYNREDTESLMGILRLCLDMIVLSNKVVINDQKALTNTMTREREYIGRPKKKYDSQKDSHFKNIYHKIEDKELNNKINLDKFITKYSKDENCKIIDEDSKFNIDKEKLAHDYNELMKKHHLPKFSGIVILHAINREIAPKVKGKMMDYIADFYNKKFKVVMITKNCFFIAVSEFDFNSVNWSYLKMEFFKRFPDNNILEIDEDKKEKKRSKINSEYFMKFQRKTKLPIIKDFKFSVSAFDENNCSIDVCMKSFDLETFKNYNNKKFDKSECRLLYLNTFLNIVVIEIQPSLYKEMNNDSEILLNRENESKILLENINKYLKDLCNDQDTTDYEKIMVKTLIENSNQEITVSAHLKTVLFENNINKTKITIKRFIIRIKDIGFNCFIKLELPGMNYNSNFFLKMNYEVYINEKNEKNKINAYNMENYYFYKQIYSKFVYFNSFFEDDLIGKKTSVNSAIKINYSLNSFVFGDFNKKVKSINKDFKNPNLFDRKYSNDLQEICLDNFGTLTMTNKKSGFSERFEYLDLNGLQKNLYQVIKIYPINQVIIVVAIKSYLDKVEVFSVSIMEKTNYYYTRKIDILTNTYLSKVTFFSDESNNVCKIALSDFKYSTTDKCDQEVFFQLKLNSE